MPYRCYCSLGELLDSSHGHTINETLTKTDGWRRFSRQVQIVRTRRYILFDPRLLLQYTSNESYHCPRTCSMWISAAFTYTPAYWPPHVASYGQKYLQATSGGAVNKTCSYRCLFSRDVYGLPSRDNHCRPALHIIMRVARRGRIDYATDLSSPCILHACIH